MNEHKDIIGILKEHLERYEIVPRLSETRVKHIHDVYEDFPDIAQALIALDENLKSMEQTNAALVKKLEIAVDALEFYETCDEVQGDISWKAKDALSPIRSL